jgi:predicted enzyme related to lactoylglutathione lyase
MTDNTVRGRFVWHELVTPNSEGAQEFYSKAVGWTIESWEKDSAYRMFASAAGPLGGIFESRDAVPLWVPYIGTTDVDATVEAAKRLGAKVVTEAADLPSSGRFAVLTDAHGATFGVHASSAEHAPEKDPEPGEFSWHELATTVDSVEAFGFYRELFGWEELGRHDMGPMGIYLLFGRDGKQTGGVFNKGAMGKAGTAYWLGYVRTRNLDGLAADVKAARGSVLMEPDTVPDGHRIAQFEDPYGALFAGHTLAQDVPVQATKSAAPQTPAQPTQKSKPAAREPAAAQRAAKVAARKAPKGKAAKKAAKKTAKKAAPKKKTPQKTIPKKKIPKKKIKTKKKKALNKKTAKKVAKAVRGPAKKAKKATPRAARKARAAKAAKKTKRVAASKSARASKRTPARTQAKRRR